MPYREEGCEIVDDSRDDGQRMISGLLEKSRPTP